MPDKRALGREAEDRAARYLLEQGYTLVTRRFSSKGGEIDLVALDGETMVFVEVKARSGKFGTPEEAIDHRKMDRFSSAAISYLSRMGERDRTIRFDLVAIDPQGLRHYPDFFRMGS